MERHEVIKSSVDFQRYSEDCHNSNDDDTSSDGQMILREIVYVEASPPNLEEIRLLSYSDNSLPDMRSLFSDHTEETSSGSTTTHANNSLPEYDSFHFDIEPDQDELTNVVMEDILGDRIPSGESKVQMIENKAKTDVDFHQKDRKQAKGQNEQGMEQTVQNQGQLGTTFFEVSYVNPRKCKNCLANCSRCEIISDEISAVHHYYRLGICPLVYCDNDDDEDYYHCNHTQITNQKRPVNSAPRFGDAAIDTIPATESDEFIKYSVRGTSVPTPMSSRILPTMSVICLLMMNLQRIMIFTFSNPSLRLSYEDFTLSDEVILQRRDIPKENFIIFSNPLFDLMKKLASIRIEEVEFDPEGDNYRFGKVCSTITLLLDHRKLFKPNSNVYEFSSFSLSPLRIALDCGRLPEGDYHQKNTDKKAKNDKTGSLEWKKTVQKSRPKSKMSKSESITEESAVSKGSAGTDDYIECIITHLDGTGKSPIVVTRGILMIEVRGTVHRIAGTRFLEGYVACSHWWIQLAYEVGDNEQYLGTVHWREKKVYVCLFEGAGERFVELAKQAIQG
ncbi:hypothetical protein Tco_0571818, partial [Tanacetum coccineum]